MMQIQKKCSMVTDRVTSIQRANKNKIEPLNHIPCSSK